MPWAKKPLRASSRRGGSEGEGAHLEEGGDGGNRPERANARAGSQPLEVALKLLGMRDHSRQELVRKLRAHRFTAEQIDAVIEHCASRGWIGDEAFARKLADELIRSGKYGPLQVREKLRQKGVAGDAVEKVLEEAGEGVDWRELAVALVTRRAGREPLDVKARVRLTRFLLGRGFSMEVARAAVESLGGAEEGDPGVLD